MAQDFGTAMVGMTTKAGFYGLIGISVIGIITILVGIAIFFHSRKKWNLKGKVVLLRSNLNDQFTDDCKGFWDAENGWIVIKRKGYKKVVTRPFDPKEWLVGRNKFTVVQTGPEDFVIARENWNEIIDSNTGEKKFIHEVVADLGKRKTWKNYTERMGKKTFTLKGWLEQHAWAVAIAIILFCMFLGFTIVIMKLPSLCPAPVIPQSPIVP